jgi:hypothetical protein
LTRIAAVVALALLAAGCSDEPIINSGEPAPTSTATAGPPPTARASNAHLVDAFDYVGHISDITGYYFTTPSGKWRCAILTRVKAGCQAARNWQSGLGISGEPDGNAIVVDSQGDPQFVTLEQPEFWMVPGPPNVLPFNRILAAAGFRCNVQESGVSCLSEASGEGFTFSADGYTPQYTDVPAGAP